MTDYRSEWWEPVLREMVPALRRRELPTFADAVEGVLDYEGARYVAEMTLAEALARVEALEAEGSAARVIGADYMRRAVAAEARVAELEAEAAELANKAAFVLTANQELLDWNQKRRVAAEARVAELTGALESLLDYADRHRCSFPEHEHDCYEEWRIESEYARRLLKVAAAAPVTETETPPTP